MTTNKPESTALAKLAPANLVEAQTLAITLSEAKSLTGLLQKSPADIMLRICTGEALGIPWTTAIHAIHIVEGRTTLSADLMVAVVLSRPWLCDYFRLVQSTNEIAEYVTKRHGSDPVSMSFTIEQAKQAGKYPGKPNSNWACYTADMLRARAKSRLCREVYPDLLAGCYTPDEIGIDDQTTLIKSPPVPATFAPPMPASVIEVAAAETGPNAAESSTPEPEPAAPQSIPEKAPEAEQSQENDPQAVELSDPLERRKLADDILAKIGAAENREELEAAVAEGSAFGKKGIEYEQLKAAYKTRLRNLRGAKK